MIRKRCVFAFGAVLTMLFFLGQQSTFSQEDQGYMKEAKRDSANQHGMMMSHPMNQEMSEVRSECQKTDRSAGTALIDIRAAKSSNDPKVLKEALDKAEKQLSEIQSNMTNAMKMMNSLHGTEKMQGGGNRATEHEGEHNMPTDSTMREK